ncbi:hypothetical protein SAMN04488074_106350 [Lentzea albidocapillata subsp. violacea]|uniref:LPXTG-motif cell wall anchor domain-containing protein n=1 Tax=Lentzea albidocapillata subsp. violacea TaxID=128104 RepID=A0A1G9DQB0_9PSEU|nr:hypothetical protein [Lentzea albidocapillata]SDK66052.1 hypothetical protein SAMN04488074_106350 [Lentzea albidocapillata subsp. violacea]
MRKNLNRTMSAALLTGGLMVASAGWAQAVPVPLDINEEVRAGNLVSVPVKVCGNAINVLGNSDATCDEKPAERTQADNALVSAPVTVCGNSVGVAGGGNGSCGQTKPEEPSGTIEAPVTVCGTAAGVLGTASGDCGKTEAPEQPGENPEQPEQPGENPEQPGENPGENPGSENPGNGNPGGGDNGDNNSGSGNTGDDSGAGTPQTGDKASRHAAAVIPNLSKTGADPLEFLLAGLGLMTAGVMARRGARRTTKA